MQSQVAIDLDNFGDFEIIEECITKVTFGVETVQVVVSSGKAIDFGTFYFKDTNGDCRMNFTYSGKMVDGSTLLSFFKVHAAKPIFEVLPHAKNETGSYTVILQAREIAPSKSDLYFEQLVEITVLASDYAQFLTSPAPYYITIGDAQSYTLPAIQNKLDMSYNIGLVSGPSWITYQKGSKRFKIKTEVDSFLNGEFQLGRYEAKMNWNAKSNLDYTGSYTGVEVLSSNSEEFY